MKKILLITFFLYGLSFQQYAQVLFEENFDDSNFAGRGWYDNTGLILSTSEHIDGSTSSAEFHFNQGAGTPVSGNAHRVLFTSSDEVCLRYYVKYSSNYTGSDRNYHPHEFYLITTEDPAFIGPANTHLTAYVEQNEGTPMISIQDALNIDTLNLGVDLTQTTENRAVAGCNGDADGHGNGTCYTNDGGHVNSKEWRADSVYFTDATGPYYKNDWHYIEAYIKLNSISNGIGVADGIMEYWYDGELLISHNNIMYRTGQRPDMEFNQLLIGPYIGAGSPIDQTFWIDDLKITKTPTKTDATTKYTLMVENGKGSGNFAEDQVANISPNTAEAGKTFDQWTGDIQYLNSSVSTANNSVAMPAGNVSVTATFQESGTNIALNKSITASGIQYTEFPASFAVDGDINTNSSTDHEGYPQWLEVDLGDVYDIYATELVCYLGRAYQFTVDVKSTESESYTQIVDRTNNTDGGTVAGPIRDEFTASARYVKITVTGCVETTGYISLNEFRVFGNIKTGIETKLLTGIMVYPNPAKTMLIIAGRESNVQIEVYTLLGSKIYETSHEVMLPHQLDIASFQEGTYILKVSNSSGCFMKKVIKK